MNHHKKAIDRTLLRFSIGYWCALLWIAGAAYGGHLAMKNLARGHEYWAVEVAAVEAQLALVRQMGETFANSAAEPDLLSHAAVALTDGHTALTSADPARGPAAAPDVLAFYGGDHAPLAEPLGLLASAARNGALRGGTLDLGEARIAVRAADQLEAGYASALMAVKDYAATSAKRAETLASWAFYSTLFLLFGVALAIFRPLTRRLSKGASQLYAAHEELHRSARHDVLTGLPNRAYMKEFLAEAIRQAREGGTFLAVLHYDLAGFSSLNKLIGEDIADAALKHVAKVIRAESRKGDFVARVGIDEFVVIQSTGAEKSELTARAKAISKHIATPVEIHGTNLELLNVCAAAIGEAGELEPERLLKNTEIALGHAKAEGAGAFVLYDSGMRTAFEAKQQMRLQIKEAFEKDEFEPYFQPQICLRTGRIEGFEALARWRHSTRGVLTPYYFLYAAAEFGVGDKLDELIMEKSLDAMVTWKRADLKGLRVGVNFASEQLSDPFMIEKIKWALDRRELTPECVCIEILETVLMEEEGDDTVRNIEGLGRAGFSIDLDDFGTGHASIATLQQMKVDRIKIDRSFITDIDKRDERQKVVSAMITLAHSLNTEVLAEGVENDGEFMMLRELGCDYVQGFGIARPMPATDVIDWCRRYQEALNTSPRELAG